MKTTQEKNAKKAMKIREKIKNISSCISKKITLFLTQECSWVFCNLLQNVTI
jgi:hypothetical protein